MEQQKTANNDGKWLFCCWLKTSMMWFCPWLIVINDKNLLSISKQWYYFSKTLETTVVDNQKKKQTNKTTIKQQTTTKNDPFVVGCRHQCHNPVLDWDQW